MSETQWLEEEDISEREPDLLIACEDVETLTLEVDETGSYNS
jgi:hypothetical protein